MAMSLPAGGPKTPRRRAKKSLLSMWGHERIAAVLLLACLRARADEAEREERAQRYERYAAASQAAREEAALARARLAHLYRGWHRRRAPRCHRQRTRAAEAPLAGACGEMASVSARLPAAARRTGRPSSRAAPSEPSGRPHRSVGGSSVTTAGLSSHPHAAAWPSTRLSAVKDAVAKTLFVQRNYFAAVFLFFLIQDSSDSHP